IDGPPQRTGSNCSLTLVKLTRWKEHCQRDQCDFVGQRGSWSGIFEEVEKGSQVGTVDHPWRSHSWSCGAHPGAIATGPSSTKGIQIGQQVTSINDADARLGVGVLVAPGPFQATEADPGKPLIAACGFLQFGHH